MIHDILFVGAILLLIVFCVVVVTHWDRPGDVAEGQCTNRECRCEEGR